MSDKHHPTNAEVRLESDRLRAQIDAELRGTKQPCNWHGCQAHGEFKAPAGRNDLRNYILFCLEHIREYNQRWDFFAGMSADEIEGYRRADVTWHRPSWQFGGGQQGSEHHWQDPFDFFAESAPRAKQAEPPMDKKTREMVNVLELGAHFSEDDLKAQYKKMAKRHHPDLHGGDRKAEERLKHINEAYAFLKRQFA